MSGSTIGAVVGAGIGFALGPIGALAASTVVQIGWIVGSAIGGYVDPVKIQGPRLTDARAQTSSVGGQIPFGYGRFTTAGNIIWAGKLVETKKTQRQGKGGGAKTTTYSYTRSYAIGICQGPIQGLLWIKRNGKKVWTSDLSAPVEDKEYAAKWGQKLTIYNGGEDQMPDSTIVAAKGAGNVSAFRGLAYVVIEDDDLTEVAGAVPQYEFCVIATPPEAYFTSKPYNQFWEDTAYVSAEPQFVLRDLMAAADLQPDAIQQGVAPVGGALVSIYKDALTENDHIQQGVTPVGGSLLLAIQFADLQPDAIQQGVTAVGGRLVDIPLGEQESDAIQQGVTPVGGQLY